MPAPIVPYEDAFTITKSDSITMPNKMIGIYVGGTGDVNVETHQARTVKFSAVPVGTILPIKAKRVLSTGTTATLMIGLLSP